MSPADDATRARVLTGETTRAMLDTIPERDRPTWVPLRIDHTLPGDVSPSWPASCCCAPGNIV